jgi:hypothetical protein
MRVEGTISRGVETLEVTLAARSEKVQMAGGVAQMSRWQSADMTGNNMIIIS